MNKKYRLCKLVERKIDDKTIIQLQVGYYAGGYGGDGYENYGDFDTPEEAYQEAEKHGWLDWTLLEIFST